MGDGRPLADTLPEVPVGRRMMLRQKIRLFVRRSLVVFASGVLVIAGTLCWLNIILAVLTFFRCLCGC